MSKAVKIIIGIVLVLLLLVVLKYFNDSNKESVVDFKTEQKVETVDNNLELSEEVEFDDDELNEVLKDDINLKKE